MQNAEMSPGMEMATWLQMHIDNDQAQKFTNDLTIHRYSDITFNSREEDIVWLVRYWVLRYAAVGVVFTTQQKEDLSSTAINSIPSFMQLMRHPLEENTI